MGFMDSLSNTFTSASESAKRTTKSTQIKIQREQLLRRRNEACTVLGVNIYQDTYLDEEFRTRWPDLYATIENIDSQITDLDVQLDNIAAAQAQARAQSQMSAQQPFATPAPAPIRCTNCGEEIPDGSAFCSHCGTAVAIEKPPVADEPVFEPAPAPTCPKCGAVLQEGDRFCLQCGESVMV